MLFIQYGHVSQAHNLTCALFHVKNQGSFFIDTQNGQKDMAEILRHQKRKGPKEA